MGCILKSSVECILLYWRKYSHLLQQCDNYHEKYQNILKSLIVFGKSLCIGEKKGTTSFLKKILVCLFCSSLVKNITYDYLRTVHHL